MSKRPQTIRATLYHLMAAMQERCGPEDDALIVGAVAELMRAGRLRFLNGIEAPPAER